MEKYSSEKSVTNYRVDISQLIWRKDVWLLLQNHRIV